MKAWVVYCSVLGFALLSFIGLMSAGPSPEHLIHGPWKESTWEYEYTNKTMPVIASLKGKYMSEDAKDSTGQNLIIHKAETWEFLPHGKLRLTGKNIDKTVTWRIKGRGNILQLKYDNHTTETYIITELNKNTLQLNFETDIQARGIAKLTFEKI